MSLMKSIPCYIALVEIDNVMECESTTSSSVEWLGERHAMIFPCIPT